MGGRNLRVLEVCWFDDYCGGCDWRQLKGMNLSIYRGLNRLSISTLFARNHGEVTWRAWLRSPFARLFPCHHSQGGKHQLTKSLECMDESIWFMERCRKCPSSWLQCLRLRSLDSTLLIRSRQILTDLCYQGRWGKWHSIECYYELSRWCESRFREKWETWGCCSTTQPHIHLMSQRPSIPWRV